MSPRCRCVASCIFLVLQANCSWKGHVCLSEVYHCCTFFQDESDVFFHLARFAAVGSCCCIAFRAKLYTGSGIIVRVFDQVMMFAFLTASTTVLLSIPWHFREKNMFSDDLFCFFFKFFTALFMLVPSFSNSFPCLFFFFCFFAAWFFFNFIKKVSFFVFFLVDFSDKGCFMRGGTLDRQLNPKQGRKK